MKEEIERHVALGIPLAVKVPLGKEWDLDGELWNEMKGKLAGWDEVEKDGKRNRVEGYISMFLDRVRGSVKCYLQTNTSFSLS